MKFADLLWNDDWSFTLTENGAMSIETALNDKNVEWRKVEIPHDWLIGDTRDLYRSGDGWYRKIFFIDEGTLNGKVFLSFDGVYMDSTVYVNGKAAGDWKYGYSSFYFDITKLLTAGENVVCVLVRYRSPNSRWYSGAGIYRNIFLKIREKQHIEIDGVYISPRKKDNFWEVNIETELHGEGEISHEIFDAAGNFVAFGEGKKCAINVENPKLWDIYKGNLYRLKTVLRSGGKIVDAQENTFGFRTVDFDPNKGFLINGRREKLHGVCMHHDLGALGAAMNINALRRQLEILINFGVNAIRSSHNMPSRELVKLCNEMGLLLDTECFDMWEIAKTQFDYARFFKEWYKADIKSWVKRDRNAPCVIMWSIGNEIPDTNLSLHGTEIAKMLKTEVLKYDPNENAVCTIASNYMGGHNAQDLSDYLKQGGYNYGEQFYKAHHEKHPDWFIYGSETSSAVRSRGIYHMPADTNILTHEDLQCSDLGNSCVIWGKPMDKAWIMDRDSDFCGGQFVWTGFDYIGEPTPYSTKNSYFGIVDTAGFFKESYYFYRSVWTDAEKSPFVRILPAWDFNEGQDIDVKTYSNLEDVELFLNGRSLGRQHIDLLHGEKLYGSWKVKFTAGELTAKAYDKNGLEVAFDRRASFGDAAKLSLTAEKSSMKADGQDLIFIRIAAFDKNGEFTENARDRVKVEVSGAGRLVGLDSGDSTDYDSYKGNSKRLFGGLLTAIIGSVFESGDVNVTVTSDGLEAASLTLFSEPCEIPAGTAKPCAPYPVYVQPENNKISARKISLKADRTILNKENPSALATAEIFPANSDFGEIKWKCVLKNGLEAPFADSEPDGFTAKIKAKGDGDFILRASCSNGFDHPEIISELNFHIEGLGECFIDPYKFVSASFFTFSQGEFSRVDKGALSGFSAGTRVMFDNIDFGAYGSDKLTLFIGNDRSHDINVKVYSQKDRILLDTIKFPCNNGWNDFYPSEFTLPKKVKGIVSLCFEFSENCIFGGFSFKKLNRSFALINAGEYDEIYGDGFKVNGEKVENIGNNVVIGFRDMDFGEGADKITLCAKTPNSVNSVQLRFTFENGEQLTQSVDFENRADYEEQTFAIKKVSGKIKELNFVFMPGSNFDFHWFRFERE